MGESERDRGRERDLVLAPNEFAFIADETKGNINVYVGPHKTSLANTDRPVVFDYATKRFDRTSLEQATQVLAVSPEGWYLVLKNPSRDGSRPRTGALNNLPELDIGRKVNIPGPVAFALWPGQMVRVLQGHHLRSNQYLCVRVYDEEAAKANWKNAVIKPQSGSEVAPTVPGDDAMPTPEDLTMGKLLVIRGTDVAFYIPPTGVEVVPDEGSYVRSAVTLERLEYCILLDENGNKRFIRGPAVVFPRPTEAFVEKGGSRKFRAIELNENSGLYVKVIAPYEEDGRSSKIGDELFITGREQMIYFPRPEHAIIKYGEHEIHYAIAIPAGEARYVLDRHQGGIGLKRGPAIYLPDPRAEVIVRRVLDARTVGLWFPGNRQALDFNARLAELQKIQQSPGEYVLEGEVARAKPATPPPAAKAEARASFVGDDFTRQQTYTSPRSIVLDTRYDGAVCIGAWTGYAVMVVSKTGERRVIVGPQTYMLEYDETLQTLELSTGTPKTDDALMRTAYLRVLHNKVSDKVDAETRDLCQVHLHLSYRVNFEGEPNRWFDVENYVKFLTDHLRSLIRGAVKQHGIEHFYANAVSILRDVVLGPQGDDGKRPGRGFRENGMRVYDVEVLDVTIGDADIAQLLVGAQQDAVRQALSIAAERRRVELTGETESAKQAVAELESGTRRKQMDLRQAEVERHRSLSLAEVNAEAEVQAERRGAELSAQEPMRAIHEADLARKRASAELEEEMARRLLAQRLEALDAEVRALVQKAGAVSPELVSALQAFGDRALVERVAQSMAPLAILGGESVVEVLARLLEGTPLARLLGARPEAREPEAS